MILDELFRFLPCFFFFLFGFFSTVFLALSQRFARILGSSFVFSGITKNSEKEWSQTETAQIAMREIVIIPQ